MAKVDFKRVKTNAEINNIDIKDGNFIVTGEGGTYIDYGNERVSFLTAIYPVGSIYMSVNDINPSSLFGFGTWERIENKFLLGASDSHIAGSTGGEETHALTINEMPPHNHSINNFMLGKDEKSGSGGNYTLQQQRFLNAGFKYTNSKIGIDTDSAFINFNDMSIESAKPKILNTGNGNAFNNMPPYLSVYIWKRTA